MSRTRVIAALMALCIGAIGYVTLQDLAPQKYTASFKHG